MFVWTRTDRGIVGGRSGTADLTANDGLEKGVRLDALQAALCRYFPEHTNFLPGQREALEAVLGRRDVVAVLPTGGGKTLVYQLAGTLLPGTTVVATPLVALMQDQVRRLSDDHEAGPGQQVGWLTGSVRRQDREHVLQRLARGALDFFFSTPEQLTRADVHAALGPAPIDLFCVDEAHCISEWGFDFRPAYRELGASAHAMGRPPILALTATAPEAVRHDIAAELGLDDAAVVAAGFDRPNLSFEVVRVTHPDRRDRQLAKLLTELESPVVVYCTTRRESEETALALLELGLAAGRYHGGMDRALRAEVQSAFVGDGAAGAEVVLEVLCATSAFGMGIDKPDVRAVVHRTMPDSVESYWQEAGRAGRDGEHATCVLLYHPGDRAVHEHLHRRSRPSEATVARMIHVFGQITRATPLAAALTRVAQAAAVARSGAAALADDLLRFGFLTEPKAGVRWRGEPAQAMEVIAAHQATQVEVEASRLDMVVDYAETAACRRRYLLNYLGDDYPAELCLRCDNCLRSAERRSVEDWDEQAQRERLDASRGGPFSAGQAVTHPQWGAGTVQRVEGEILVVRFLSVGYRTVHGPTVVDRGLLRPG